jgi:hypothetical protein
MRATVSCHWALWDTGSGDGVRQGLFLRAEKRPVTFDGGHKVMNNGIEHTRKEDYRRAGLGGARHGADEVGGVERREPL